MKRFFTLTLLLALTLTAGAQTKNNITIQGEVGTLKAVLTTPYVKKKHKYPLVVIMHGFTGNKNEKMLIEIADGLQAKGIASIRFDFNGHGESDGEFRNMTIRNEIEDAKKVIDYAKKELKWVDPDRIGVLGHSQGGVVASMVAGELGIENIKKVVLLAPAANIGEGVKKGVMLGQKFDPVNIPETVTVWGHQVGREYIKIAQQMDMYGTAAKFTGPVLIIHGEIDKAVPCQYGKKYAEVYQNANFILQPKDDHGLGKRRANTLQHIFDFFKSL